MRVPSNQLSAIPGGKEKSLRGLLSLRGFFHLLVINPANDRVVVARAIDWGPNTFTRRVLDLSPKTLTYLKAKTDVELICSFSNTENNIHSIGPI